MAEKQKGWFSHMHMGSEEHAAAHDKYLKEHGKLARREKAQARAAAREGRSPEQQLSRLNARLGEGVGATVERARLNALINPEKEN